MKLFTVFIKKAVIIHIILLNNISKICLSESYYSYGNPETFQNPYQRAEAPILSNCAFAKTYSSNTCKKYITSYNRPNCEIQPYYRPSCIFATEFPSTSFPSMGLKTSEFEKRTFGSQRTQEYNTIHCQPTYNTLDQTQQWLIPDYNSSQIYSNQYWCGPSNNRTFNFYNEPEIQKNSPCIYQTQEQYSISNQNDQEMYVGNPNYYQSFQGKIDIFTYEIYPGHSLSSNTLVKSVCSSHNQPPEFIDIENSEEFSIILPTCESTDYIFPNINKDTVDNYSDLKNTQETRSTCDIQNVCDYYDGQNTARTTNYQTPDVSTRDYCNHIEPTSETPYHNSDNPSLTVPIYVQHNTETLRSNPYNSGKLANQYFDNLSLDITTSCLKEHILPDTEITSHSTKRPYDVMSDGACASDDNTHTILHHKTKYIRKDCEGTKISVAETVHSADTSTKKFDHREYFNFILNNHPFVFKREKRMNVEKTIILDCSGSLYPKAMNITYENFLFKYIYHNKDIKKMSFSYNVPILTSLNFQISGPLRFLKLSPVLKDHEISQSVYGVAYFEIDIESDPSLFKTEIVLKNTIPQDLNSLIELIMNSEFSIYNLSKVEYNEILTFKKIGEMRSVHIVSTREFLDGFNKREVFMNYYKDLKCKYNSILDIPIRIKAKHRHYVIAWEPSIYVIVQAIAEIHNQLKSIEEIISNPNITKISKKSNIKQHIENIINFSRPEWAIKYNVDNDNNHDDKGKILSFFQKKNSTSFRTLE